MFRVVVREQQMPMFGAPARALAPLLVALTAILPASVAAAAGDDQIVCVPAVDGISWDCVPGADAPAPAVSRRPEPIGQTPDADAQPPASGLAAQQADSSTAAPPSDGPISNSLAPAPAANDTDLLLKDAPVASRSGTLAERQWRSREQLSAAQQLHIPEFCSGGYTERDYPLPLIADSSAQPAEVLANQLSFQRGRDGVFDGGVVLTQGNRRLTTAQARVNEASRDVVLRGGVEVSEPGLILEAGEADLNLNSKAGEFRDVEFVMLAAHLRGEAAAIAQDADANLAIDGVSFTRCEPQSNVWSVHARSLVVEDGANFGVARGAALKVGDVPVFYTPYLRFPVTDERLTGWLFPNMGYSADDGVDFSMPFYWNIAANADATITPRLISERGVGVEAEGRYLNTWSESVLGGAFLASDDLYNGVIDKDDFDTSTGDFDPADRWLYALNHDGEIGNFRTLVDYTAVSDRDYFRDLGSDLGLTSTNELERRGEIQYSAGGLFMRLWAQRFQRLDEIAVDAYQRLPEFEVTYDRRIAGPLEFSLGAEWVSFDRDNDDLSGTNAIVGNRTHVEPRLRLPLAWPFGFLTTTAGYRFTEYDLRDTPVGIDDAPDRGVALGSVDGGLFFERDLTLFDTAVIQTLEPRAYYLYQEFDDQSELPRFDATQLTFGYDQLFRDNRFSGIDRIGDANQAAAGVTTRFLNAANGREYFRFSIGEIFYFDDRRVTLSGNPTQDDLHNGSAIASTMSATFGKIRVAGDLVWDPYDNAVDESRIRVFYKRDARRILNIGYRKNVRSQIEQLEASAYWPLLKRYSAIARFNYDTVFNRTIEAFAGLEYNDCCWQVRLFYRRSVENDAVRVVETAETDEGIFIQFVFKGLAGFGNTIDSAMQRGIPGYRPEEHNGFL
ncbi:MAG: LPS assembly protein LptD [Pseudomonadaceae bacterium]|nr:LPS assembly protein LptD [Pseudomonadaceae bacterium]